VSWFSDSRPAALALADGTVFRGRAFGATAVATGEVCFNTSLAGYQEILTDPSYAGQIVTMTCTQIGNVGTNDEDEESARPWLSAFVVKEHYETPSSWRSEKPLGAFLEAHGVPGISGIDTRALVRRIRDHGFQNGVVSTDPAVQDEADLVKRAKQAPPLDGRDLVADVTCTAPYEWKEGLWQGVSGQVPRAPRPEPGRRLVVYDFGVKRNILRHLVEQGFEVTVVPARTPAAEALAREPDAIFLSNGPGDPRAVEGVPEIVRELAEAKPLFGICLGHQLLGRAIGATTFKLPFGHRGGNQPVQDLRTGRVEITSQNHGFAVDEESLKAAGAEVTHINLNDRTIEGFRLRDRPVFSVQYHPEASPGPHDADYLFDQFVTSMLSAKQAAA